jgi:protein-tyrosine-phosphatase
MSCGSASCSPDHAPAVFAPVFTWPAAATRKVAFVCLHGSAKSLIAAAYFNGLAHQHGLDFAATTSGPEPDAAVPPNVIEGLRNHAIEVGAYRPTMISAAGLAGADLIVSFACDAGMRLAPDKPVERWDECPAVSDDFETAWRFITSRVERLFRRLAQESAVANCWEQGQ